jgi:hypothetical protein
LKNLGTLRVPSFLSRGLGELGVRAGFIFVSPTFPVFEADIRNGSGTAVPKFCSEGLCRFHENRRPKASRLLTSVEKACATYIRSRSDRVIP